LLQDRGIRRSVIDVLSVLPHRVGPSVIVDSRLASRPHRRPGLLNRRGPPSMPRAELGTVLPTRQGQHATKCYVFRFLEKVWRALFSAQVNMRYEFTPISLLTLVGRDFMLNCILSRVGKGRSAGSIELRVSPSPSKIPYGGFSPVRLQMDRQWRPSTTSRGLVQVSHF